MDVRMLTVGPVGENCFLFRAEGSERALIVDPGEEAPRILKLVDELRVSVEGILLTHTHFDHIGAVAPVAAATGAPVWCPEIEVPVLADINSFVPWPGFGPFESYDADHTVAGGEKLDLAGFEIDVIFTPGPQPRARHLLGSRRSGALLRRRPLPGLGRPHRPPRRRLGDPARLDPDPGRGPPARDHGVPGPYGDHHPRRGARLEPVSG